MIFSQFSLADSLYANKYYGLAVVEYQRDFFFNPNLYKVPAPRLHYAISLLKNKAAKGLEELEKITKDFPDLSDTSKIIRAKYYLGIGNYYAATECLSQTADKKLLGLAYLLDGRFIDARNLFTISGKYELAAEINNYIHRPEKSVMAATLLSFVCPGSGEIYAGNFKVGLRDFLLNLGTGYLLYDSFKDKRYVDAGLIISFLFNRFYFGSITNAQRLARERNEKDKQQWLNYIKDHYFEALDF